MWMIFLLQDYKTYLDFVLALENRKEPQVGVITHKNVHARIWTEDLVIKKLIYLCTELQITCP